MASGIPSSECRVERFRGVAAPIFLVDSVEDVRRARWRALHSHRWLRCKSLAKAAGSIVGAVCDRASFLESTKIRAVIDRAYSKSAITQTGSKAACVTRCLQVVHMWATRSRMCE